MDTFLGSYFHFRLELALKTWAKTSWRHSLRVHDLDHTHSLASVQLSGLSNQLTLLPTENCLQYQKWCPIQGEGSGFYARLCQQGEKWSGQCWPRPFYSQPRQLLCARHPCWNPPTSPYPTSPYLENGLRQLITCGQSQMTSILVISC